MYDAQWVPGRWWRVLAREEGKEYGFLWMETSDEEEARGGLAEARAKFAEAQLQRSWIYEEMRWMPDGDASLAAG